METTDAEIENRIRLNKLSGRDALTFTTKVFKDYDPHSFKSFYRDIECRIKTHLENKRDSLCFWLTRKKWKTTWLSKKHYYIL